jgi:hypothetical protein
MTVFRLRRVLFVVARVCLRWMSSLNLILIPARRLGVLAFISHISCLRICIRSVSLVSTLSKTLLRSSCLQWRLLVSRNTPLLNLDSNKYVVLIIYLSENKHRPPRRYSNSPTKVRNYTPYTQYGSVFAEPASLSPSYNSSTSSTSCTVFSSGGSRRQLSSSGGTVPPTFLREPSPPTTWGRLQHVLNQVSRCKKPVAEFFEKLQRTPARREAAGPRFVGTG